MRYEKLARRKPERRMIDIPTQAEALGISVRTHQRTIKRGEGPPLYVVSARRQASFEDEFADWVARRERKPVAPGGCPKQQAVR